MTAKEDKDAKAAAEETEETAPKQDETVPGGDFIVDGRHVNSEGEELGKKK